MKTKKYVLMALFVCVGMGLYALESLLPPLVLVPGAKLGLANIVTLVTIYVFGKKEAFVVLMLRIIMCALLFGQVMSLAFSLAGGLLSYLAVCIAVRFLDRTSLWAIGIIGAFAHNLGQIVVAVIVTSQLAVAYYFLFLILTSIVSGFFTGICAKYSISYIEKIQRYQGL